MPEWVTTDNIAIMILALGYPAVSGVVIALWRRLETKDRQHAEERKELLASLNRVTSTVEKMETYLRAITDLARK